MKLTFRPLTVSITLAFLSVAPVRALALGMSPMYMELAAGGKTSAQFQFSNPSQTSAAVEIKIETLTYDEAGNRRTTPDGGNLIVVPPVAVVAPGSTQTFRVQWVGSANIARSQTFLITARQLPVKLPQDGGSRIQMVQAFGALLTVAPVDGTSHLQLVSSQPTHLQGKPAVALTVENPGNAHALISNSMLRVGHQTYSPESMRARVGFGIVEPGKRRRFVVPIDQPASGAVLLDYRQPR